MHRNNDKYYQAVLICMKLNLKLNIGDGYLNGDAATDSLSYKINIQQGWPDPAH